MDLCDRGGEVVAWDEDTARSVRQAFARIVDDGRAPSLQSLFRGADSRGSGRLSRTDFQDACDRAGLRLRPDEVAKIMRRFDSDKDGLMNWSEFLEFLRPEPTGPSGRRSPQRDDRHRNHDEGRRDDKPRYRDEARPYTSSYGGGAGAGAGAGYEDDRRRRSFDHAPITAPSQSRMCRELLMVRNSWLPGLARALTGDDRSHASSQGSDELVSHLRSRFTRVDRERRGVVSTRDVQGQCVACQLRVCVCGGGGIAGGHLTAASCCVRRPDTLYTLSVDVSRDDLAVLRSTFRVRSRGPTLPEAPQSAAIDYSSMCSLLVGPSDAAQAVLDRVARDASTRRQPERRSTSGGARALGYDYTPFPSSSGPTRSSATDQMPALPNSLGEWLRTVRLLLVLASVCVFVHCCFATLTPDCYCDPRRALARQNASTC